MRILVADDEAEILDLMKRFLETKKLSADCVSNGDEALALIEKNDYDVVFLDENMPGLTGLEITEEMKKKGCKAKIIILTGYPCISEEFSKLLGADEYLEKPVDLEAIGKILDKYGV